MSTPVPKREHAAPQQVLSVDPELSSTLSSPVQTARIFAARRFMLSQIFQVVVESIFVGAVALTVAVVHSFSVGMPSSQASVQVVTSVLFGAGYATSAIAVLLLIDDLNQQGFLGVAVRFVAAIAGAAVSGLGAAFYFHGIATSASTLLLQFFLFSLAIVILKAIQALYSWRISEGQRRRALVGLHRIPAGTSFGALEPTPDRIKPARAVQTVSDFGQYQTASGFSFDPGSLAVNSVVAQVRPGVIAGSAAGALDIDVAPHPLSNTDRTIKRAFDIIFSLAGLLVLAPLLIATAIAIRLDSRGPVFFTQIRNGYRNKPFRMLKFRTMFVSETIGFQQTIKNDPRVTNLGKLLRRTSLDELPQLVNILLGQMSVVGPRPHAVAHNDLFTDSIGQFARRHSVKPGLTGWAQINGLRGETDTLAKMSQRIEYDLFYIDNWSLLWDMEIVISTLLSEKVYTNAV